MTKQIKYKPVFKIPLKLTSIEINFHLHISEVTTARVPRLIMVLKTPEPVH